MKKIILLITLVVSPVFAQEEEQEVEIQIEAGGGLMATVSSNQGGTGAIAAYPDKSVWFRFFNDSTDGATYCWVDENEEPRCKLVRVDD